MQNPGVGSTFFDCTPPENNKMLTQEQQDVARLHRHPAHWIEMLPNACAVRQEARRALRARDHHCEHAHNTLALQMITKNGRGTLCDHSNAPKPPSSSPTSVSCHATLTLLQYVRPFLTSYRWCGLFCGSNRLTGNPAPACSSCPPVPLTLQIAWTECHQQYVKTYPKAARSGRLFVDHSVLVATEARAKHPDEATDELWVGQHAQKRLRVSCGSKLEQPPNIRAAPSTTSHLSENT